MSDLDRYPFYFDGVSAILASPKGKRRRSTGVLLCRPWGHDEVCSRKFYKILADAIASAGFPALRFDYPGTVDSFDPKENDDLESWVDAADKGANVLRTLGCETIVVFGLNFGTVIAHRLIQKRNDLSGAIFAAPLVNGRRYIRETKLSEKLLYETEQIPLTRLDTDQTSILGNVMPPKVVEDLSKVKLDCPEALQELPVLCFARENIKSDQNFSTELQSKCEKARICDFPEFADLTVEVLTSKVPYRLVETLVEWLKETQGEAKDHSPPLNVQQQSSSLETTAFQETTSYLEVADKKLMIVVTSPLPGSGNGPVFIFGNTGGYDHHGGLARNSVHAARVLATHGVTSLRFDSVNTGDSYPDLPVGQEVLYTPVSIEDFQHLVDYASERWNGPITLVGRCSSAYAAFHTAANDSRVRQLVLVNQLKFIWDKDVPNELKNMMYRSGGEYKKRLSDPKIVKRLLKGDIDVPAATKGVARLAFKKTTEKTSQYFPRLTKFGRMKLEALDMFQTLQDRKVPVHFLCSIGDGSIEELKAHFGPDLSGLSGLTNVTYTTIEHADHRLTPVHARTAFIDTLVDAANASVENSDQTPAQREQQLASTG
ncbi:exosortase A system-associated hydrolase 1 [Roseibium album]|nr:exosortase A system-associated hydrolase 1 [Roseibium album]